MAETIPIEIVPYNPRWPSLFDQEKERLFAAIGKYVKVIEHVGSTAVPGLSAKPVIDILIGVYHLEDDFNFIPPLQALGYVYKPQYEIEFPERRYLNRIIDHRHTHHLHIVEPSSAFFQDHILFRDHLRNHPADAERYAALKVLLAQKFRNDRQAYTDGKTDLINEILQSARSPQ